MFPDDEIVVRVGEVVMKRAMVRGLLAIALVLVMVPARGADDLRERTRGKVAHLAGVIHWDRENRFLWYQADLGGDRHEVVRVDLDRGERGRAFDHEALARFLSEKLGRNVEAERLPVEELEVKEGGLRVVVFGRNWRLDDESGEWEEGEPRAEEPARSPEPEGRRRFRGNGARPDQAEEVGSPDGRWTAFVKDHNVWIRDKKAKETFGLSAEGNEFDGYGARFFWSPDSKRLVALRTAKGDERRVHLVESSPRDVLQPRLMDYEYRKPGDRIPITKPHLFDVEGRKEIAVSDDQFENPWSLERFQWDGDSKRFTFLDHERGHQVRRWLEVDAESGEVKAVVDERSETFIDYAFKTYLRYLEKSGEVVWMSERDGWNHLYLIDAETGEVKNRITEGEWVVRGVDRVDEEKRQVWFHAGGIYPGQDPYHVHYARVGFDGSGLTLLTEGDGTHRVEYSPDRKYYVDTYSRVDLPPVTELRRAEDGSLVKELERGDWSELVATGWQVPERVCAKGRDGETGIYGVIYRPTSFDREEQYPVIEHIYAGPHDAHVPKGFAAYRREQSMAELGFLVVQIDGMGTNWRSKAFHDVCWKNLADAGFPDRIAWMGRGGGDEGLHGPDKGGDLWGVGGGAECVGGAAVSSGVLQGGGGGLRVS